MSEKRTIGELNMLSDVLADVQLELIRARELHPEKKHLLHVFAEESGEVTKAYLDHHYNGAADERYKEIVQTMAMGLRLILDGDPDFAPVVRL